jgi:hypothetical protein
VVARYAAVVVGAALLTGTAFTLFQEEPHVSLVAVIAGALLLVTPLIVDKLEALTIGTGGVALRLTSQIAEVAPKSAGILEQNNLTTELETYAYVYSKLSNPAHRDARVELLDGILADVTATARSRKYDPAEVKLLFSEGTPVMRMLALALMEGDPRLLGHEALLSAVRSSRSGNEQYHGLLLAQANWSGLPAALRAELLFALRHDAYIQHDPDRREIADRIMLLAQADKPDEGDQSEKGDKPQ